jgi:hypothetical protein
MNFENILKRAFYGALFLIATCSPTVPQPAGEVILQECLSRQMESENYETCIGRIADPCLNRASDNENALQRLSGMAQCYEQERQVWESMTARFVSGWRQSNGTPLIGAIENAIAAGWQFREAKCAVFQDIQQFGMTGAVLSAECRATETARMAIFVGYRLD